MKIIIITLVILNSSYAISMERRKSQSPARTHTLLARNRSQSSLGDKIRVSLHLKSVDESTPIVDALITDRRAPQQPTQPTVAEEDSTSGSPRNLNARVIENYRNNFVKTMLNAYKDARNIRAENDDAYKRCENNIKVARYQCTRWLTLTITENSSFLDLLVDQEIKQLEDEFDKKINSIMESQKK